ncbi:MAG TPA: monovalent cation/H+ antiporter complex subunit F [Acidimicrobiia bacterium]|nr:monovalent cation/H+ antiporter complex subunit F [Acidimicrobiia bacterium]
MILDLALVVLALAALGFVVRAVAGPSLADRVVAVDALLVVVLTGLAAETARSGRSFFVDAALVIGLLGFVGTGVAARFIEQRGA